MLAAVAGELGRISNQGLVTLRLIAKKTMLAGTKWKVYLISYTSKNFMYQSISK